MTKKKKLIIAGAIIVGVIFTLIVAFCFYALFIRCDTCGGTGIMDCPFPTCIAGTAYPLCTKCDGDSVTYDYFCDYCNGTGRDYSVDGRWKCNRCRGLSSIDCPDCDK